MLLGELLPFLLPLLSGEPLLPLLFGELLLLKELMRLLLLGERLMLSAGKRLGAIVAGFLLVEALNLHFSSLL
jgi:hypothetical protein